MTGHLSVSRRLEPDPKHARPLFPHEFLTRFFSPRIALWKDLLSSPNAMDMGRHHPYATRREESSGARVLKPAGRTRWLMPPVPDAAFEGLQGAVKIRGRHLTRAARHFSVRRNSASKSQNSAWTKIRPR